MQKINLSTVSNFSIFFSWKMMALHSTCTYTGTSWYCSGLHGVFCPQTYTL